MTDEVANLMLEQLPAIRADMASMRSEMLVMRQHLAGLPGAQVLREQEVAEIKVRLDRVERRLELVD